MKRLIILGAATGIFLGGLLSSGIATGEPKRGGTLTMAISKDMTVMNPLVATSSTQRRIRDLLYESLLGIDANGNLQPNLAESWKISNDGKVYTFFLRRGVKFHNGQEMTAADAKFAMDYTMNPKNGARGYTDLKIVDSVEAADRYTLSIRLQRAAPVFIYYLTEISAFSVIPKGSLEEGVRKPASYPPGTGPFKFVEWKPRQRVVFDRFDDYWGHKAYLDRVVLRLIKDITVRFAALRAGDVDLIERTSYEWIKEVTKGNIKGINVVEAPNAGGRSIEFNVTAPPFNDKKMRLAVAHAINRKEILDAAYLGFGTPSEQEYPKGHAWYIEEVSAPEYDPEKARALLKEAGYKGEPVEIMGNQGEAAEIETATIQAQLRRIGMNVKIKIMDRGMAFEMRRKGKYQFKMAGAGPNPYPLDSYMPKLICEKDPSNRIQNETGYCNKELDALFRKAEIEHDMGRLRGLIKRIVSKMHEDVPLLDIGFTPRFFSMRDYVKGFTTNSDGDFRMWGGGLNYVWLDK